MRLYASVCVYGRSKAKALLWLSMGIEEGGEKVEVRKYRDLVKATEGEEYIFTKKNEWPRLKQSSARVGSERYNVVIGGDVCDGGGVGGGNPREGLLGD